MSFGEVRGAQLAESALLTHLHVWAPGNFSDLLRSVQMLNREWGVERNGKLPHLFMPSKTATMVLEFSVKTCLWTELQP